LVIYSLIKRFAVQFSRSIFEPCRSEATLLIYHIAHQKSSGFFKAFFKRVIVTSEATFLTIA
ncbi:hypothetical protein P4V33_10805, partial [Brevibacillus borstelensis]|uniref:hypothetical protein n=1 Tax=Brevibacillus borstelensis TaxID=45462 RepID=UPI002E222D1A|nr:hypothetical protein [Brevibacillus borstelensis]